MLMGLFGIPLDSFGGFVAWKLNVAGILVRGAIPHAAVSAVLITVAKAVALVPTWTERTGGQDRRDQRLCCAIDRQK
jgi:hypothetical protein